MVSDKILALLVCFLLGAAVMGLLFSKLIGITLQHSSALRSYLRDRIDRRDREVMCGASSDVMMEAVSTSKVLEFYCSRPIKYIDASGTVQFGQCPERATDDLVVQIPGGGEHKIPLCTRHFDEASEPSNLETT